MKKAFETWKFLGMKREAPCGCSLECVYALPRQDASKGHRSFPGSVPSLQPPLNPERSFKKCFAVVFDDQLMLLVSARVVVGGLRRHQPRDADHRVACPAGTVTPGRDHPGNQGYFTGLFWLWPSMPANPGRSSSHQETGRCDRRSSNPPGTE